MLHLSHLLHRSKRSSY